MLAIDPDIPSRHQRLPFAASPASRRAHWVLNREMLGDASTVLPWPLVPGRYRLELVGVDGRTLDAVTFQVRGVATHGG